MYHSIHACSTKVGNKLSAIILTLWIRFHLWFQWKSMVTWS